MAVKVASIIAELKMNMRDFDKKVGKAERKLGDLEGGSKRTSASMGKMGAVAASAAAAAAAAAAAFAAKSLAAFGEFEKGMNEVFTLLPGISDEAMGKMEQQVKDLSVEMGVLPEKTIPALYQALSAGVPQDNVFDFLELATKASIGGVTDLETAVDGITSTVNAFGAANVSAEQASDIMFTTVRLGKTTMDELSRSLFQVNPVAAGLGVKFEDVSAAMAALTAQGVPTRVAATQIRQALVELGKDGTIASDMFKELSGQTFTDFIKSGGTVKQAFDVMKKGADQMGSGVGDLFGSVEAGMAVIALTSGTGAAAFGNAMSEMRNSSGATEAAFNKMDQGVARSVDKLKAKFSVLMVETGEKLAPAMLDLVDAGEAMLPVFGELVGVVADVVSEIVELARPVLAVIGYLGDLRDATDKAAAENEDYAKTLDQANDQVKNMAFLGLPALSDAVSFVTGVFKKSPGPVSDLSAEMLELKRTQGEAQTSVTDTGKILDAVVAGPYKAFQEGLAAWQATTEETTAAAAQAYEEWKQRAITATEEAETAMRDSVDNTVSLFGGMPAKIKVSVDEIIANLLAQREMATQYEANMRILAKAGLDGLVGELQSGTPEAMAAAAAFAGDLNSAYRANLLLRPITRNELDMLAWLGTDTLSNAGVNWANAINNAFARTIDLNTGPIRSPSGSISVGGSIMGFAEGGIVPGPVGAPMPAIVHGGEEVIPVGPRPGRGGSGDMYVSVTVEGSVVTERDLAVGVARQLERLRKSGATI